MAKAGIMGDIPLVCRSVGIDSTAEESITICLNIITDNNNRIILQEIDLMTIFNFVRQSTLSEINIIIIMVDRIIKMGSLNSIKPMRINHIGQILRMKRHSSWMRLSPFILRFFEVLMGNSPNITPARMAAKASGNWTFIKAVSGTFKTAAAIIKPG